MRLVVHTGATMAAGRLLVGGAILLGLCASSGCHYLEMIQRRRTLRAEFENQPRLTIQRALSPEKCLRIAGPVQMDSGPPLPLLVAAVGRRYGVDEVVGWRPVASEIDLYSLLVPGGEYQLVALADLDGNGWYEDGEIVGRTPPDQPVVIRKRVAREGYLVDGPPLVIDRRTPQRVDVPLKIEVSRRGYVVPSLDDDFFNPGWGDVGLWDPDAFMVHTQGYLFALEEFDPSRTQVLFVHGAVGTPRDFESLVSRLDRTKFQPLFYYYPSGLPLAQSGAVLEQLLAAVAVHPKLKPRRLAIVAHSMGGLVAREAVSLLTRKGRPSWLTLFVTMASPFGGMGQAGAAVEQAPELVPSWRDLAPGSPFLERMAATRWPADLPFHVLFGFDNASSFRRGLSGDSVVPLSSQIPIETQGRATRLYGLDTTHAGILRNATAAAILNSLLVEHASPPGVLGRTAQALGDTLKAVIPGGSVPAPAAPPEAP
jgi:pimeloyl-ACP methyl ester carboxylesterase